MSFLSQCIRAGLNAAGSSFEELSLDEILIALPDVIDAFSRAAPRPIQFNLALVAGQSYYPLPPEAPRLSSITMASSPDPGFEDPFSSADPAVRGLIMDGGLDLYSSPEIRRIAEEMDGLEPIDFVGVDGGRIVVMPTPDSGGTMVIHGRERWPFDAELLVEATGGEVEVSFGGPRRVWGVSPFLDEEPLDPDEWEIARVDKRAVIRLTEALSPGEVLRVAYQTYSGFEIIDQPLRPLFRHLLIARVLNLIIARRERLGEVQILSGKLKFNLKMLKEQAADHERMAAEAAPVTSDGVLQM